MKKLVFFIIWFTLIVLIWFGIEWGGNKITHRFDPLKVNTVKRSAYLNQDYFDDYFLFHIENNYNTCIANRAIYQNKKKRYRIFCLGASTTAGYPYGTIPEYKCPVSYPNFLRAILQYNKGVPEIEILNAGCSALNSQSVFQVFRDLVKYDPDVIIVYSAHNEYFGPNEFTLSKSANQKFKSSGFNNAFLNLRQTYVYQGLNWIIRKIIGRSAVEVKPRAKWAKANLVTLDDPYNEGILKNYETNLRKIVRLARKKGILVILCTPVTNYTFPPFLPTYEDELTTTEQSLWDSLSTCADEFATNSDFQTALDCWEKIGEIDSTNANVHYFKGVYSAKLGDYATANSELRIASDLDALPFRAKTGAVDICRKVALEEGAILADMDRFFSDMSGKGYAEPSLMLDHVHPTANGYYYMGLFLAKTMVANRLFFGVNEIEYPPMDKTKEVLGIFDFVTDKVEYDFGTQSYIKGLSKLNIPVHNYLMNVRQQAKARAELTNRKFLLEELAEKKQQEKDKN